MRQKTLVIISCVSGFLAVALGAFGAHALKASLSPEMLDAYRTGVQYHLVHSAVLLAIALYGRSFLNLPAMLFIAGIILFSFSLYTYAISGIGGIAMITPFGGLCLLAGWIAAGISAYKNITNGS